MKFFLFLGHSKQVILFKQNFYENKTSMKTKLLFSIALLFCFVESLIAQTTFTVDNIKYEVTSSITPFTVKITGLVDTEVNSVTIPLTVTNNSTTYNVTAIGDRAFLSCTSLTSVSISDSVTSIGESAFQDCGNLTSVSIGNSVTSIGHYAFYNCNALTSFTCLATTPPNLSGTGTFLGVWQSNIDLYVPESALSAYRNADQWKDFRSVNAYTTNLSTTETKNNLLKVYPNPAKDHVVISNISKGANISVYDLSGKILFQTKSPGNSLNINTSSYKNGIYLVKVGENTTKIIVNK